jgi:hypothetical protein
MQEQNIISIEQIEDQSVIDYDVNGVDFDLSQDDTVTFKGFEANDSDTTWKITFVEELGVDESRLRGCLLELSAEGFGSAVGWFPVLLLSDKTAAILSY